MKKNSLTIIGISILFLGLAIAPSINANGETESERVAITTEICGLGGGKQTVQLAKEEAEEVDKIFDTMRLQINESNSREEVNRIFKEAVVDLDKFGLLGGLSIKQAQRLVVCNLKIPLEQKIFDAIYQRRIGSSNDFDNANCQIYGEITNALYFDYWLGMYKINWAKKNGYSWIPAWLPLFFSRERALIKRASFIQIGYLQYRDENPYRDYPSKGEIWTNGSEGIKEWDGSLKGMFYEFTYGDISGFNSIEGFIGVKLFRGLNFVKNDVTHFFGFAKEVKITKWNP